MAASPARPPEPVEHRPAVGGTPALEIHRSHRRRRTVHARSQQGRVVVRMPAGLDPVEEERLISELVGKVTGAARAAELGGDEALTARANELADRYLDGVRPASVRWSGRMQRLLGSCALATGEITISRRVATMPAYVVDAVLVHELAHLHVAGHSPAFHALVARYPQAERAEGFLEGYTAGQLAAGTPVLDAGGLAADASPDELPAREP